MSRWVTKLIGDVATLQRGHDLPATKRIKGDVPIVGSAGITGFHNEAKVSGEGVFVGRSGVGSMGVVSYIDKDHWPLNTSLYVKDFHGNHPKFIYYLFKTINFRALDSGTAQSSLNRNAVHLLEVYIPDDYETQKEMADILTVIENKIQLNHQTNQTLEKMAQALFESWFVDFDPVIDNALAVGSPIPSDLQDRAQCRKQQLVKFDHKPLPDDIRQLFPGEFKMTEGLGWIPKEWKSVQMKDICKTVQNGSTPKRMTSEFWENGNINWFKTGELSDSILLESSEKITTVGLENSSCKLWPSGTVLMAIYAAPTVGRLGILSQPACSNQACSGLVPLDEIGSYFIFYSLLNARDWFNTVAVGAAQQNISKSIVEDLEVVLPSNELIASFSEIINSYWKRMGNTEKETLTLIKLRDTSLPKLISGELRISEVEQQLAYAIE